MEATPYQAEKPQWAICEATSVTAVPSCEPFSRRNMPRWLLRAVQNIRRKLYRICHQLCLAVSCLPYMPPASSVGPDPSYLWQPFLALVFIEPHQLSQVLTTAASHRNNQLCSDHQVDRQVRQTSLQPKCIAC